jgi:hypothetical protein
VTVLILVALFLFLLSQFVQIFVQTIESLVPNTAEGLQPGIQLFERLGPQLVDPPIGDWLYLDESGFTKYAEMFGNLRLVEMKSVGDFPYWEGSITQ